MTFSLTAVRAPADPSVVELLVPALAAALAGVGPAVLPVPADDPALAASLCSALRPDDPSAPLELDGVAAVVATSGSSGAPKGALLGRSAIAWTADALHALLGGPGRWLLALPAWHVGGLQVLNRSIRAGTDPVAMDLSHGFTPAGFVEATRVVHAGTPGRAYTSLVPTQLIRLLDAGKEAVEALASYDAVLVGSAATPAVLAERAASVGCRLRISYGMTETSGGCCYDGRPVDGVEVRLRPEDDRVLVRGPGLFLGYRLRPDLTAAALVDGWVVTNDVGRLDDEGRLLVLGRADDVVVSGGEKVAPLAVADALRTHASVGDAAVVGVPDPEWGQVVVAYVVPAPGVTLDGESLREHVRGLLGRAAVPRRVIVVDALPMLASGKIDRAALVASTGAE